MKLFLLFLFSIFSLCLFAVVPPTPAGYVAMSPIILSLSEPRGSTSFGIPTDCEIKIYSYDYVYPPFCSADPSFCFSFGSNSVYSSYDAQLLFSGKSNYSSVPVTLDGCSSHTGLASIKVIVFRKLVDGEVVCPRCNYKYNSKLTKHFCGEYVCPVSSIRKHDYSMSTAISNPDPPLPSTASKTGHCSKCGGITCITCNFHTCPPITCPDCNGEYPRDRYHHCGTYICGEGKDHTYSCTETTQELLARHDHTPKSEKCVLCLETFCLDCPEHLCEQCPICGKILRWCVCPYVCDKCGAFVSKGWSHHCGDIKCQNDVVHGQYSCMYVDGHKCTNIVPPSFVCTTCGEIYCSACGHDKCGDVCPHCGNQTCKVQRCLKCNELYWTCQPHTCPDICPFCNKVSCKFIKCPFCQSNFRSCQSHSCSPETPDPDKPDRPNPDAPNPPTPPNPDAPPDPEPPIPEPPPNPNPPTPPDGADHGEVIKAIKDFQYEADFYLQRIDGNLYDIGREVNYDLDRLNETVFDLQRETNYDLDRANSTLYDIRDLLGSKVDLTGASGLVPEGTVYLEGVPLQEVSISDSGTISDVRGFLGKSYTKVPPVLVFPLSAITIGEMDDYPIDFSKPPLVDIFSYLRAFELAFVVMFCILLVIRLLRSFEF